ncbi:DUF1330 domain-containing protein [Ralstonia pseudosolanacearum]|uniref:DUF1330 domain-containing protein n=1 Tax=Ralstonia pseudosolanacearum TaxID=1310165 RepID=UPI0038642FB8
MLAAQAGAQDLTKTAPAATKPAYMISEIHITDPEAIKPYRDHVEATFKPYGGRFIVRGGTMDLREGTDSNGRIVIIKFDSLAQAQAWYASPEYQAILPSRQRAGVSRLYFVEGLEGQ